MRLFSVRTLVAALATLVVGLFVYQGFLGDGPRVDPEVRRLDDRRVSDLEQLTYLIDAQWTREGQLPASLTLLKPTTGATAPTRDPETGAEYGYRVLGSQSYELCAVFRGSGGLSVWTHAAGRGCFVIEARKTR